VKGVNPFTTDHPLTANSSSSKKKEHPVLSFVCRALILGLILTPFVLQRLYDYAVSDIGAEPNPFPQPFWALCCAGMIALVLSFVLAVPIVFLHRRIFRR
jgi:hypothetical protein